MLLIVVRRSMLAYAKYRVAHAESRRRGGMLLMNAGLCEVVSLFSRTGNTEVTEACC